MTHVDGGGAVGVVGVVGVAGWRGGRDAAPWQGQVHFIHAKTGIQRTVQPGFLEGHLVRVSVPIVGICL